MPKLKSLVKSIEITTAGRKRKCYHNSKHQILKGDQVLEVKEGIYNTSSYCLKCAKKMLESTKLKIHDLMSLLVDEN